jgi:cell division protein FtsQ
MRLLPDRVRVAIVERTPVAFVRQGRQIGLVDAHGVLFDLPSAEEGNGAAARRGPQYSFPVLTGISAADPQSTRAARMRIYLEFMAALDAGGDGISHKLSEVDVSNPEDVKAIMPDEGSNADILVHFGEEKYLERYHQYQQHLAEWRAQYPRLASVDMRYEQQVVLEMQQGTPVNPTIAAASAAPATALTDVSKPAVSMPKGAASVSHAATVKAKAPAAKRKPTVVAHAKAVAPVAHMQGAAQ